MSRRRKEEGPKERSYHIPVLLCVPGTRCTSKMGEKTGFFKNVLNLADTGTLVTRTHEMRFDLLKEVRS